VIFLEFWQLDMADGDSKRDAEMEMAFSTTEAMICLLEPAQLVLRRLLHLERKLPSLLRRIDSAASCSRGNSNSKVAVADLWA